MILFYIILIVRVDGFFIPCETNIDCEDLDEFENYHFIYHYHYVIETKYMYVTTKII